METLEQKLERFRRYYFHLIEVAESDVNLDDQKVHSKILCCSILDAISKSIFPEIKSNCQRFIYLVRQCKSWPDSEKVSVLHLLRLLEINPSLSFEEQRLKKQVLLKYSRMFEPTNSLNNSEFPISSDMDVSELLELWPRQNSEYVKVGGVKPYQLKHEYMLWLYRNALVHEYRSPGNGVDLDLGQYAAEHPFYQQVTTVDSFGENQLQFTSRWELVYPSRFFLNLCKNAVEVACEFNCERGTSPFNGYSRGTYWLPDFNE
ncbi:hypothetical protein VV99796_03211 [Vibrio vulnificus]|uniref:hypothetical protein n=1 Tax=Vibrio vulnificus TaxID=672 RepID=UPI000925FB39|nr:hypothetical protein [Vibrio vulnificus]EJL6400823.1 hypothetical protein [Vibrio navarrensis]EHT4943417.1 hypothetical protein [Vibrio vulnificus]EJL6568263.1 hypothetical protein [Vibrio navarrensis]OJI23656.1 hypothetical protein VV99796_03211 [Vibrio vulnificus]OJI47718.1 hypothetical protein VVS316_02691 [Vibrio vulnificus]